MAPPALVPVRWGERRYLIRPDAVVGFCNSVNRGAEPRSGVHGDYLLRKGDEGKAAAGRPNLPREFQEYVLLEPVEATVTSVGASAESKSGSGLLRVKETQVTLDAGTKRGLKVGMELAVTERGSALWTVKLTTVEGDRSEAVITQTHDVESAPAVGRRVSTRAPWHARMR